MCFCVLCVCVFCVCIVVFFYLTFQVIDGAGVSFRSVQEARDISLDLRAKRESK